MNHRRICIFTLLFLLLCPLFASGEAVLLQEGYVRVQGDTTVYADTDLKEIMGTIQDASVVYVTETDDERQVFTIAFGYDWVVRIGYIEGQSVFPLSFFEQDTYLNMARDGLVIRDIYLLNVGFTLAPDETQQSGASPMPTAAPTPLPTVVPSWSSSSSSSQAVNVIMQPVDQVGFNGEMVVLAVGAENVRDYQWQFFKDGEWVDSTMSQSQSAAMKLVVFPTADARIYRCKMTGLYGDVVYSNVVTIAEQ